MAVKEVKGQLGGENKLYRLGSRERQTMNLLEQHRGQSTKKLWLRIPPFSNLENGNESCEFSICERGGKILDHLVWC